MCPNKFLVIGTYFLTTVLHFSELWNVLLTFSNTYMVAVKSVILPSVPPSPQYVRSEITCAGFLIHAIDSSSCTVSLMKHLQVHLLLQMWETLYSYFLINCNSAMCVHTRGTPRLSFQTHSRWSSEEKGYGLPYTNKIQFSAWKSSMSIRN